LSENQISLDLKSLTFNIRRAQTDLNLVASHSVYV